MAALSFDNSLVRALPADPLRENSRRQVPGACYSLVRPTPVARPRGLAYSREMASVLGLSEEEVRGKLWTDILSGNNVPPQSTPWAARYGGHQFGTWAGQLGDGRAISIGEVVRGERERYELQLKGAGPTPYSRTADGRAVLRSSLREFLCSEAMFHLGVPTTRALSLVSTGEMVVRDMFYDGNVQEEPGAVVCRVAPTFVRFGNFEIHAALGETRELEQLFDYTVSTHFGDLWPDQSEPRARVVPRVFARVVERTAQMICHWMRVGFVHGVMNTDNMSILGLTIDYGPYGWLEDFDPGWTPNTTDAAGRRYCFGNQPKVAQWNLARLAGALLPLADDAESLSAILDGFGPMFDSLWHDMMAKKLGLASLRVGENGESPEGAPGEPEDGGALLSGLFRVLQAVETDMTIFFAQLALLADNGEPSARDDELLRPMAEAWYRPEEISGEEHALFATWIRAYRRRSILDPLNDTERGRLMRATNPRFVLRNYMAQLAIDDATEALASMAEGEALASLLIDELLEVLRHPYDEQPEAARWFVKRPEWARNRPGCSMLSCSS